MTYPTISRAVVVADHDAGIEMRELAVPELAANGILVEIEAATACGTDLHIARGHMRNAATVRPPLVLGHEMVGRIVALDAGRPADSLGRPLAEGDLIAWASPWCGNCYWCTVAHQPTLCVNANLNGFGPLHQFPHLTGGFADLAYVSPNSRVVRVPEGISAALASSATCAFRTVVHAFETVGQLRPTDSLVIQGCGAVGLYATAYAKIMGIPNIIVVGAPDERLALARRWGASVTMSIESTTPEERLERVLHATDGRGADIVAECSGFAPAFTESLSLVRRGGRVLVVGAADPRPSEVLATNFNMRQVSVSGSISADISHYWRALSVLSDRAYEFDFSSLLGASHALDDVESALQELEHGAMKPIIIPNLPSSRGAAA